MPTRNYVLLKENPRHPSLQFKKVGRLWSVRVGLDYRALAVEAHDGLVWFWIGSHAQYLERIKQDAKAGKLDRMADEALAEHRAGRTREL